MRTGRIIAFFASGFYTGYSPLIPGTTGSIPPWIIGYFLIGNDQTTLWIAAGITVILSVYLSTIAEPIMGHDSKKIVIDEWAGMFISFLLIPFTFTNYLIAFLAFRALDAIKFFPANEAEKLPKGWGVTADDIVAGIQANLLTRLIIFLFAIVKS